MVYHTAIVYITVIDGIFDYGKIQKSHFESLVHVTKFVFQRTPKKGIFVVEYHMNEMDKSTQTGDDFDYLDKYLNNPRFIACEECSQGLLFKSDWCRQCLNTIGTFEAFTKKCQECFVPIKDGDYCVRCGW